MAERGDRAGKYKKEPWYRRWIENRNLPFLKVGPRLKWQGWLKWKAHTFHATVHIRTNRESMELSWSRGVIHPAAFPSLLLPGLIWLATGFGWQAEMITCCIKSYSHSDQRLWAPHIQHTNTRPALIDGILSLAPLSYCCYACKALLFHTTQMNCTVIS